MAWLWVQAAPVEIEVVDGGPIEEDLPTVVATDDFGADPLAYLDVFIQLNGLGVTSMVGSEAFFIQVPNQTGPYLVKMLSGVVTSGVVVESMSRVSVVGTVQNMSDSVADAWVASGAIGEGDKILALFAEPVGFFEAAGVTVIAPPPPPEDN